MSFRRTSLRTCFAAAIVLGGVVHIARAQPLTSAFDYQGELSDAGTPATGTYDVQFALFDGAAGGVQVGPTLCADNLSVTAGRFVTSLNFGSVFTGQMRYLEVRVRPDSGLGCANTAGFTTLSPRQDVGAAPNAAFAIAAGSANSAGSATTATTASNAVLFNGQAGSFYQNATNLTAGTLGAALLPATAARTDTTQTFTGAKTFSQAPVFSAVGSPFVVSSTTAVTNLNADLLDGLNAASFATSVHGHGAADIASGTLADARLSANVAMRNTSNFFAGGCTFSAASTFNGLVGIGTAAPGDLLHVFGGDAGTVLANGNARVIVEDNTNAYLNFLTPLANENGILFGVEGNGASGGIIYNASGNPLGLQFRTGGNSTKMVIDDTGNVGIGTIAPTGRLTVAGTSADVVLPTQSISTTEMFEESFTVSAGAVNGSPTPGLSTSWATIETLDVTCESSSGAVYLIACVELRNDAGLGSNTVELAITKAATPGSSEVHRHTVIGDSGADTYASVTIMGSDVTSVAGVNAYKLMAREVGSSDTFYVRQTLRATYTR